MTTNHAGIVTVLQCLTDNKTENNNGFKAVT